MLALSTSTGAYVSSGLSFSKRVKTTLLPSVSIFQASLFDIANTSSNNCIVFVPLRSTGRAKKRRASHAKRYNL
jgi:hypothetical protein